MRKQLPRTLLPLLLAVFLAASACLPAAAEKKSAPGALVEQLISAYAKDSRPDGQILAQLAEADPELAEKWTRILNLWGAPAVAGPELPDGLPEDDTLCLVCLGFHLNADGTMRPELVGRLEVLLAAAQKYPRSVIVCTGGPTAAQTRDTEAGRMAKWLERHGVDPARILAEDRSLTTAQNAVFTLDLLSERCPQVRFLAVVTSDYHISAGVLLLQAEAILRDLPVRVAGCAAWDAPGGSLSARFTAGQLRELSARWEKRQQAE